MDDPIRPAYVEELKRMTPAQKLAKVSELYEAEIRRRVEHVRKMHPDWSEERLEFEARRSLLYSGR